MKCYYEELELERDASESEIKTAYRKLALKWHPDKNPECMNAAKERFQLIQQAYEVLSDPQERAWYDNHREQILRGKNSDFEDNCLNLFPYFTVSCYKGYGDDENGFYAVYEEVFKKISAEDAEFMDSKEDFFEIPKFGNSKSSYEDVVGPFYAYWSAYCTKRTYTWLCPYDIREVKDRRILRAIEKEMKKVVQKAKKERNEEVRNLVSFMRKRDNRVQAFKKLLEERSAFNRQKQERNRMEQIKRRQQELDEMRYTCQGAHNINDDYEEQLKQLELEYSSDDDSFEDKTEDFEEFVNEEGNNYNSGLYCVACNKEFKNEKSFANHETSRKHRENIEKIKVEMLNEEILSQQEEKSNEVNDVQEDLQGESQRNELHDVEVPQVSTKSKTKSKKESKNIKQSNVVDLKANTNTEEISKELDILNKIDGDDDGDWDTKNKKVSKKNRNKSRTFKTKSNLVEHPVQTVKNRGLRNEDNDILKSEVIQHVCSTCKANFESKNKLFSHLKLLNHAVFVPNAKNANDENTKFGKNKRRN